MDDAIEERQPNRDEPETHIDQVGQRDGRQIDAPDARDIDHEDCLLRQDILSVAHELVDKNPKPIRVVFLVLVDHVERQLKRHEPECRAPVTADGHKQAEDKDPGKESAVHPVVDEPLHAQKVG